jgi:hypothetical protein
MAEIQRLRRRQGVLVGPEEEEKPTQHHILFFSDRDPTDPTQIHPPDFSLPPSLSLSLSLSSRRWV